MTAETAAAIASVCACIIGVANVVGQVLVSRHVHQVHRLVDGLSTRRARRARAEGVASERLVHGVARQAAIPSKWGGMAP